MSYQIQIKRSIWCKWEDLFGMKNRFQTMSDALEKYARLRNNQKNYGNGGARLRIVRYLK